MTENSKPPIEADFQAVNKLPGDMIDFMPPTEAQEAIVNPAMTAFTDTIDRFGVDNHEVVDRKEELQVAGAELIESFGVKPEFFEDESRAAIFTSLAGNYASAKKTGETDSWTKHMQKKEFVANATFLLTRKFSDNSESLNALHEAQQNAGSGASFSEGLFGEVMGKYTDPTLSKEVTKHAEENGIFAEVLGKLGIDPKDATPIQVNVLSTGRGTEALNFDLDQNGITYEEARDWADGLEKRAQDVAKELPHMQDIELAMGASGFATEIEGKHHLMIPMAAAEVLLAEKNEVALRDDWVSDKPERVVGLLQHEFTHLQGTVRVEGAFGYTIEERRAEYFSGDTSEYFQEKGFLNHMALLKGKHIVKLFDEQAALRKAGQEVSIYKMMMDTYGLDATAQIAAAVPSVYMRYENSEFMKGMVQNLGSYDQITAEYAQTLSPEQKAEALKRVEDRIDMFSDRPGTLEHVIWQTKGLVKALGGEDIEQKRKRIYKEKLKSINFQSK